MLDYVLHVHVDGVNLAVFTELCIFTSVVHSPKTDCQGFTQSVDVDAYPCCCCLCNDRSVDSVCIYT